MPSDTQPSFKPHPGKHRRRALRSIRQRKEQPQPRQPSRTPERTRRELDPREQHVGAQWPPRPQHHAVGLVPCDTRHVAAGQPLPRRVAPGAHSDDNHISREGVGPALDKHAWGWGEGFGAGLIGAVRQGCLGCGPVGRERGDVRWCRAKSPLHTSAKLCGWAVKIAQGQMEGKRLCCAKGCTAGPVTCGLTIRRHPETKVAVINV